MPFDLEGKVTIDYSEVDRLGPELEARTAGVQAKATVDVDSARARADTAAALRGLKAGVEVSPALDDRALDPLLRDLKQQIASRAPGIFDPIAKAVDLDPARDQVRRLTMEFQRDWAETVAAFNTGTVEEFTAGLEKVRLKAEEVATAMQGPAVEAPTAGARPSIWNQPMFTAALLAGGVAVAGGVTAATIGPAMSEKRMATTMDQVFGAAAESFVTQAEALSDASGYADAALMQVQVSLNKVREAAGLTEEQIALLTKLSADMAATSGLPQYADNLAATSNAVMEGLRTGGAALADFGIRLDDDYVKTQAVNRAYAEHWDSLTEVEKAQARYNVVVQDAKKIADDAKIANDEAAGSWRKLTEKLREGKEAVGEVLLPVVDSLASLASRLPPEVIQGAIWTALVAGIGAATIAVVNGIRQVITWLWNLAVQAKLVATSGGLPGLPGKTPTTKTTTPAPAKEIIAEKAVSEDARKGASEVAKQGAKTALGGVGTVAAIGAEAAAGFLLLDVYGINEARREVDNYWDTVAASHKQAALLAKKTGWTGYGEDVYGYGYVARSAQWTGSGYEYYNYAGKKLSAEAQAWQEAYRLEQPAQWAAQNIKIKLEDATRAGVQVTDARSYAESLY